MNFWIKVQNFFDVKSGFIIGLWSLTLLAGAMLSIVETHQVSTAIATCFCTIITGLAGTNIAKHLSGKSNDSIN